jgi:hypothetical protein
VRICASSGMPRYSTPTPLALRARARLRSPGL